MARREKTWQKKKKKKKKVRSSIEIEVLRGNADLETFFDGRFRKGRRSTLSTTVVAVALLSLSRPAHAHDASSASRMKRPQGELVR